MPKGIQTNLMPLAARHGGPYGMSAINQVLPLLAQRAVQQGALKRC